MTSNNDIDYIALIPDYLNDLLSREEKTQFEITLKSDPNLQNELEEFKEIKALYHGTISETPEPSKAVFNKIIEELDSKQNTVTTGFREIKYRPTTSTRIYHFWSRLKDSFTLPWGLALIQAAVIVVLLVPRIPENSYNTLGITRETEGNQEISLNIVFNESARESEIRELLIPISGSIINGPSPQGRYQISIPSKHSEKQIVSTLKQSELILFVEKAY